MQSFSVLAKSPAWLWKLLGDPIHTPNGVSFNGVSPSYSSLEFIRGSRVFSTRLLSPHVRVMFAVISVLREEVRDKW